MPTVLCLGGTGQFGLPIARHLATDPIVDRVIVAGRDLAKAQAAAATTRPTSNTLLSASSVTVHASSIVGVPRNAWFASAIRVGTRSIARPSRTIELCGVRKTSPRSTSIRAATVGAKEASTYRKRYGKRRG